MIEIGRFRIERIEEIVLREPVALFADWDETAVDPIADWFVGDYYDPADGCFASSIHTWLVRDGDTTILIDTGGGNAKPRPLSPRFHMLDLPFLDRLAARGVTPESVDHVFLTHLHVDHVGWNTRMDNGQWVPTFPRARHYMTAVERDWRDPAKGAAERPAGAALSFIDSVVPVLTRGLGHIVDGTETGILPGIDLIPLPGHAPGMFGLRLRDGGQEALFVADVMHQPIQVHRPSWSSRYCEDPATATATRARVLDMAAESGALVCPAHFGGSHCGHVRRDGAGYAWVPSPVLP